MRSEIPFTLLALVVLIQTLHCSSGADGSVDAGSLRFPPPADSLEDRSVPGELTLEETSGRLDSTIRVEDTDGQVVDVGGEWSDAPILPDSHDWLQAPDLPGADDALPEVPIPDTGPDVATQPEDATADTEDSENQSPDIPPVVEPVQLTYDVVVAGAGSGGAAAALQAARLGMSVALLEETDWVGGQMTAAAVANMDEAGHNRDSGVYKEFIDLVQAHYAGMGKSMGTCYWSTGTQCFEPKVGRQVLESMLAAEPGIDLYFRTGVTAVEAGDVGGKPTVQGVLAKQAGGTAYHFTSAQLIDATEYGDLLPLSPAQFRAGNSVSPNVDPSACVQDNTYTAVIRKYSEGLPGGLGLASTPPGLNAQVLAKFEGVVQTGGFNWLSGPNNYPADWLTHVGYRGMPDSTAPGNYTSSNPELISRTGVNWANDYPFHVADMDPAVRKGAHCEAKLRTLQFLHYMQHDLGQNQWSVADDEGFNSSYNTEDNLCDNIPPQFKEIEKHFPVMPYVRESRRLVGIETVTAGEIRREVHCSGCPPRAVTNFPTALAIGDYPVDLHACNTNADLELQLESEADVPPGFVGGPFQVPLEAFIPQNVDGFLAAEKNLSVSRLTNGAVRLQPITMLTGQAAGALAALAILEEVQPRQLEPLEVQNYLLDHNCRLALQSFSDVPRNNPHWKSVQLVAAHEIMLGYSDIQFGVSDPLLRMWAAVAITRLFNIDTSNPPAFPTFQDVPDSHPAYAAIEALVDAGITSGCSVNPPLFCPEGELTRAELATFIIRGLGIDPANAPAAPYFTDLPGPGSHWSFPYVQLVYQLGLMDGCTAAMFCPDQPVTRGETADAAAATLLHAAL